MDSPSPIHNSAEAYQNSPKSAVYIQNTKPQHSDKPFEKGMGIDIYFDGCKLLPETVTVIKAIIEIIDADLNVNIIESDVADLDGFCYNPSFDWKMEIRPGNLIPTAMAFITLLTIDKLSNQPKIIGYSAINLFINRSTKKQPNANTETVIPNF